MRFTALICVVVIVVKHSEAAFRFADVLRASEGIERTDKTSQEDEDEPSPPPQLPSKGPPCELPPFTNLLPLNFRRELRKIWSGFITSSSMKKCDRQLAQTRELIESLPEDVKVRVLEWGSTSPGPSSKTHFLVGLSDEQTREFTKIMSNRSISSSERQQMLREWATVNLDLDGVNQIEQFIQFLQRKNTSFRSKVEKLSNEAKLAHEKLESLRRTKQQIYNQLSASAKQELAFLYRAKCPRGNIWETDDLDAEEVQLACSEERKPKPTTPTTTEVATSSSTTAPAWTRIELSTSSSTTPSSTPPTAHTIPASAVTPLIPPRPRSSVDGAFKSLSKMPSRTFIEDPSKLTDLLKELFPHTP